LKNGENKIEIEFFTQCSDLQNSLACAIGAVLFGINSQGKIRGHIRGLRASANRPVIQIPPQYLTLIVPTVVGELELHFGDKREGVIWTGDSVNIKNDGVMMEFPTQYGWATNEITNCFPELKNKMKWGLELEGSYKEAFISQAIAVNAPNKITFEAASKISPESLGIQLEQLACEHGGLFPIVYSIPSQEFSNLRIGQLNNLPDLNCIDILQGYSTGQALPIQADYSLRDCWDIKVPEVKLPASFESRGQIYVRGIHVYPIRLKPKIEAEITPKAIPAEFESETRIPIVVKGKVYGDDTLLKDNILTNRGKTYNEISVRVNYVATSYGTTYTSTYPQPNVVISDGEFFSSDTFGSGFLEAWEGPVRIEVIGPFVFCEDWCKGALMGYGATGYLFLFEKDGKSACMDFEKFVWEIPRSGCVPSFEVTATYSKENGNVNCEFVPKVSVEGCKNHEWEIRDFTNQIICSGIVDNEIDTSACIKKYSFEGKYARLVSFKLKIGKLELETNALCGDPAEGILVEEKFLCPKSALQKIDSKYRIDLSKCTKVVE
jgi:hypothetical protein